MSEHRSMFDLINLVDNGEAFFVIIWNMYSISKKLSGNFSLVSETQHLLSNLKINYHFLQSTLESIFSQQHLGLSLKEFIAPCSLGTS